MKRNNLENSYNYFNHGWGYHFGSEPLFNEQARNQEFDDNFDDEEEERKMFYEWRKNLRFVDL